MTVETAPVASSDTPPAGVQPTAEGGTPEGQGATPGQPPEVATEVVYEFTLPEGMESDKASAEEFVAIAKELKLPKEQAQKVVDLAIKRETARAEAFNAQVQGWEASVKADKELGGDKLPETLAICRKAIDLGPPGLKDLLSSTKMGSHPDVVKWAYAIGKALSEDRFVQGGGAPKGDNGTARVLYPNQT